MKASVQFCRSDMSLEFRFGHACSTGEGTKGEDGATFTPHVSEDGVLSFTNDKSLENPAPVCIKGEAGKAGADGVGIVSITVTEE